MKKLKIWSMSNQDSGVQFYRINQPSRFIAKQKLAIVHTLPFFGQHVQHFTSREFREYQHLEGKWADVLFSTCATDQAYLALLWALKDTYKLKLVIDLDDDILATNTEPSNPAYRAYSNPKGRHAEFAQACLRQADMVTVSTEYLKKKYESINPNIIVIKNTIDHDFWKFKNKPDDITIGFTGSGSHQQDWLMIEPVLKALKDKYKIKVKMVGPMQGTVIDEQIQWVDQLKHPETVAKMGFSIGVAPLKDSLMNRAKSNLRWLEYSALKIPTVASDVVPFRNDKNLILVDNEQDDWYNALEKLILDKKYATELGLQAYNSMKEDYDPNYWARELYTHIQRLF